MKDCSPPAFPSMRHDYHVGEVDTEGMSLRDYFAAHAPAMPANFERKSWFADAIVTHGNGSKTIDHRPHYESLADQHARWALEYANAMMLQKEQP